MTIKRHRYSFRSEYTKSGLKHLGEFEIDGYFNSLEEAKESVCGIDKTVLKVITVRRTSDRLYMIPFIQQFRALKLWYLKQVRKRNAIFNLPHGHYGY